MEIISLVIGFIVGYLAGVNEKLIIKYYNKFAGKK